MRTIFVSEDEDKDRLQSEEVEKVPRETGYPADVEVFGHDAGLHHGLEADG